ncbi:hypothetical protein PQX77_001928 [Marasmius sp. AFHP31]|nr:hypothetical protein PQX77_001928 [Marasmius sp. AFHP31]
MSLPLPYLFLFILSLALEAIAKKKNRVKYRNKNKCYDENHQQIPCPPPSKQKLIIILSVVFGTLFLIIVSYFAWRYYKNRQQRKENSAEDAESLVPKEGKKGKYEPLGDSEE